MKILVTGGAGFIGSNFIKYWLKKHAKARKTNLDKLKDAGKLNHVDDVQKKKRNTHWKRIRGKRKV